LDRIIRFSNGDKMSIEQQWVSQTSELFSLPEAYLQLKQLIDDTDSSMQQFAAIISSDPALTINILHMVNSAYFNLGHKIGTVSLALNMLGTQQVHDLALATSVTSAFDKIPEEVTNMTQFWHKSIHCGVLAQLLARRCNVLDSERLFIAGLLHDIGHLIMYQNIPEKMNLALQLSKQKGIPLHLVEQKLVNSDYAKVGSELMQVWGLPKSIIITTQCQLMPTKTTEYKLQSAIIHIAATIANASANPGQENLQFTEADLFIDPVIWQITGLSPESIEPIYKEVDEQLALAISILFPRARASVSQ